MNTNDMRILIAESGSGFGGSAKYLASLLPLINRDKYEIALVSYGSGPFIHEIKQNGWFIHQFSDWRFPHVLTERKLGNKIIRIANYFITSILQLMILIPMIAVWLIRNRIRLVHLNNEILSHLPLVLAAKLAGCRVICHFHGWRKLTKTEKWVSQFVDFFISVTQSGADFYSWQLNGKNVVGIPNGLVINEKPETDDNLKARYNMRHQLGLGEDDFLAVLVGRLIPLKGHSVFFQAIEKARTHNSNIRGLVVGEDPSGNGIYRKKLLAELEALGIRDLVQFLPWQDHMGPVYQASDVVLQPSIEPESFGYVALEGMAAGKPVIASRLGGLIDVVRDGETGLLVEAGNADELSKAMNRIANNSSLASDFGIKGSQRAKTVFTITHNAEQIMQVYDQLLPQSKLKWQSQVKEILLKTGTLSLLRNLLSSKVPILMYHKISNEKDPFFPSVSEKTFRQQMSYIKQNYQIISMDGLVKSLRSGERLPQKSIVVTFDDGNMPTLKLVSPILEELNIPAAVFLSGSPSNENNLIWTDLLRWWLKLTQLNHYSIQLNGHVREWKLTDLTERLRAVEEISRKLKLMHNEERKKAMKQLERDLGVKTSELPQEWLLTNNQIKFLSQKQIKFGGHTITHSILSRMSLEEARYEIFESKRWLENVLNEKVRHFAYPNGELNDFTAEHENLVAQAGFDSGSSSILGLNDFKTNRYALRRIYAAEESLANFTSRLVGIGS